MELAEPYLIWCRNLPIPVRDTFDVIRSFRTPPQQKIVLIIEMQFQGVHPLAVRTDAKNWVASYQIYEIAARGGYGALVILIGAFRTSPKESKYDTSDYISGYFRAREIRHSVGLMLPRLHFTWGNSDYSSHACIFASKIFHFVMCRMVHILQLFM